MQMIKNILKVLSANLMQLIVGILISFFVPKIMSIPAYANFKSYTLFLFYLGFLQLGFVDGLYIKYGGEELEKLNRSELKTEQLFYFIFQLIISVFFLGVSLYLKNEIILMLSLTILPLNMFTFYRLIYQAIGQFDKFSKLNYTYSTIYFICNFTLIVIIKSKNPLYYMLTYVIAYAITSLIESFRFNNMLEILNKVSSKCDCYSIFRIGLIIMIGNFSSNLIISIDRLFVKFFFATEEFSYFSFAVSMISLIVVLISSVSATLYNYFAKNKFDGKIGILEKILLTLGFFSCNSYFVFEFFVKYFLGKYTPSLEIIKINFMALPFIFIINSVCINLYKTKKKEKKYFKMVTEMLIVSILLNSLLLVFKDYKLIAMGTVLTYFIWYIRSLIEIQEFIFNIHKLLIIISLEIIFFISTNYLNSFFGIILYNSFLFVLIINYFDRDIRVLVKKLLN